MNTIKNKNLVKYINDNAILLDANLEGLTIYQIDNKLNVDLTFSNCRKTKNNLILTLSEVKKINFYYDDTWYFYSIERFKLIENKSEYYLSLDPYDESNVMNDEDGGVIISKKITWKLLPAKWGFN
ncbi:MAG: hypothetical protein COB02_14245 [Candidatus Cloacimonadota bacterium]|nr:MAG: hypothetical protein COB02_14245 [Candidatus Cloacimonadota bacterium]